MPNKYDKKKIVDKKLLSLSISAEKKIYNYKKLSSLRKDHYIDNNWKFELPCRNLQMILCHIHILFSPGTKKIKI